MISQSELDEIMDLHRDIEDKLSVSVKIPHSEVTRIVVEDLSAKYLHNIQSGNKEWSDALSKVLRYYLSDDEMQQVESLAQKVKP